MKLETLTRNDMTSEPTDTPVKVVGPDGERTEPCLFRKKGLAIWMCPIKDAQKALDAGWPTMKMFNVTHELSGLQIFFYPTLMEATGALLAALTLTDWTQPKDALATVFKSDRQKAGAYMALKEGRMEIIRVDRPAFDQKPGVA